jgi:excisionase family DNA binding protein
MEIFTPDEAATQLKLHKKTIYRLLVEKKLLGIRIGGSWRISETALERFLNGGEVEVDGGQGRSE